VKIHTKRKNPAAMTTNQKECPMLALPDEFQPPLLTSSL
jgi:hypothetical protein